MEYSYKFRLYPTKAQEQQMQRTFGCCRYVYNHYLAQRINAYEQDGQTLARRTPEDNFIDDDGNIYKNLLEFPLYTQFEY